MVKAKWTQGAAASGDLDLRCSLRSSARRCATKWIEHCRSKYHAQLIPINEAMLFDRMGGRPEGWGEQ